MYFDIFLMAIYGVNVVFGILNKDIPATLGWVCAMLMLARILVLNA